MKSIKKNIVIYIFCYIFFLHTSFAATLPKNKPATSLAVVNYAKSLLLTIVDTSFRGSWVIDPENWDKTSKKTQQIQKSLTTLGKIKLGDKLENVREVLKNPQEIRNNGKIWIYGTKNEDGTYNNLFEVFFDEKASQVIGIITFDPKNISEDFGVNIGDPIDKMILVYGEVESEKDFIEDPDNKGYLGLYYLYPKSKIGFLIGHDKETNNLLVQGVLIF